MRGRGGRRRGEVVFEGRRRGARDGTAALSLGASLRARESCREFCGELGGVRQRVVEQVGDGEAQLGAEDVQLDRRREVRTRRSAGHPCRAQMRLGSEYGVYGVGWCPR